MMEMRKITRKLSDSKAQKVRSMQLDTIKFQFFERWEGLIKIEAHIQPHLTTVVLGLESTIQSKFALRIEVEAVHEFSKWLGW